jgi:hypothetical protein
MRFNNRPITPFVLGLASTLTALVAAACGGKTDSANAERHSEFQSSSLPGEDAGGSSSTPVSNADDAGAAILPPLSAMSSTPPAACPAPAVADTPTPDESSSQQWVNFQVTNTGTKAVYIAVMGRGCTDYSIEDGDGCPVPLLTWSSDPSCQDQSYGYADTFKLLAPGGTYETNWFASRVAAFRDPTSGCVFGANRVAEPGAYRVTFGYEMALPAECGGDLYCDKRPNVPGGPVYAALCSTRGTVSTRFVLPPPGQVISDAGDRTVVSVSLNADQ